MVPLLPMETLPSKKENGSEAVFSVWDSLDKFKKRCAEKEDMMFGGKKFEEMNEEEQERHENWRDWVEKMEGKIINGEKQF